MPRKTSAAQLNREIDAVVTRTPEHVRFGGELVPVEDGTREVHSFELDRPYVVPPSRRLVRDL